MNSKYAAAHKHFEDYEQGSSTGEVGSKWHGSIENCDVCSRPMQEETYMVDGPSEASRNPRWGNLCVVCAFKYSPVIGWGKAQLYKRHGEEWILIAGGSPKEIDYI